jgi:hypothetical protein
MPEKLDGLILEQHAGREKEEEACEDDPGQDHGAQEGPARGLSGGSGIVRGRAVGHGEDRSSMIPQ